MRGMGQLVPYSGCQYPQVQPMTGEQASAVINSAGAGSTVSPAGVGDYLSPFPWPIPQYLSPGNSRGLGDYLSPFGWPIPQYLTPGNTRGLGCAGDCGCGGSCGGLGDMAVTCPSGWFSCGPSQWGVSEWATVAGISYLFVSAMPAMKKHGGRAKASAKKGVSYLGTLTLVAAAGLGLYFWAQSDGL